MNLVDRIMLLLGRLLSWEAPKMPSTDSEKVVIPTPQDDIRHVEPVLEPKAPVLPSNGTGANKATLDNFLLAIRDFEGKPGDQNYRLNNPGNCRYNPSGYMPMYGKVGKSPNGFAIFKDYETGWLYFKNMVKGQIHKRPNNTILQFMERYAPSSDGNNPTNYAKYIGIRLGVDSKTFKVGNLV